MWYAKELLLMVLLVVHIVVARNRTCRRRHGDMGRGCTCGTTQSVLENTVKYPNTYNLYVYPYTGTNIKYRHGTEVELYHVHENSMHAGHGMARKWY